MTVDKLSVLILLALLAVLVLGELRYRQTILLLRYIIESEKPQTAVRKTQEYVTELSK